MEVLVNSISVKVAGLCIQNELVYQMLMKLAALKGDMLNNLLVFKGWSLMRLGSQDFLRSKTIFLRLLLLKCIGCSCNCICKDEVHLKLRGFLSLKDLRLFFEGEYKSIGIGQTENFQGKRITKNYLISIADLHSTW